MWSKFNLKNDYVQIWHCGLSFRCLILGPGSIFTLVWPAESFSNGAIICVPHALTPCHAVKENRIAVSSELIKKMMQLVLLQFMFRHLICVFCILHEKSWLLRTTLLTHIRDNDMQHVHQDCQTRRHILFPRYHCNALQVFQNSVRGHLPNGT